MSKLLMITSRSSLLVRQTALINVIEEKERQRASGWYIFVERLW